MKTTRIDGFTLMEIIVTIIIIGTLASIALPNFTFSVEKTRSAEGVQILKTLLDAQKIYEYENPGDYASSIANLDVEIPAPQDFDAPTVADPANPVTSPIASLQRDDGTYDYTLAINANGVIRCTQNTSPANTCAKLGFPTSF